MVRSWPSWAPTSREIFAVDQLHDEGGSDRGLFQAVDLRDVRVIQRGERLRFAFESRQSIRIVGERVGKNLQRDVTIEFRVPRAIDLAHPTRAERGDDLVGSEARAWRKPHRLVFSWGPRMLARMYSASLAFTGEIVRENRRLVVFLVEMPCLR